MAVRIYNPFDPEINHCIGCSPSNPIGFHLRFFEEDDHLYARWDPDKRMQGYINVLHGGIQTTLMDEIASWTIYVKLKTAGVTSSLTTSFKHPVYVNRGVITIRGSIDAVEERYATIATGLYDQQDRLCTTGKIVYFVYPQEVAIRKLHYPGPAAFYKAR